MVSLVFNYNLSVENIILHFLKTFTYVRNVSLIYVYIIYGCH